MAGRSNCFFFALLAWWRWRKRGAYWWVRESHHIAGWHWGVCYKPPPSIAVAKPRKLRFIHYEPLDPRTGWRAAIHKVWYVGTIKRGD